MPIRDRPAPSSVEASVRFARQGRRDTKPEMVLRRALHALGYRYRVDSPLPGMPRRRADLTFASQKVVVFVDGCFWHGCPEHGTTPHQNGEWWAEKVRGNASRDHETDARLEALGWTVVRVWEHENSTDAVARVVRVLGPARVTPGEAPAHEVSRDQ